MKQFLFILSLLTLLFSAEIPVNIEAPVYEFLQRMENRQIIPVQPMTRPYTRNKIASLLKEITTNQAELTTAEKKLLLEYQADFRKELTQSVHPVLENEPFVSPLITENGTRKIINSITTRENTQEAAHLFIYEKDNFYLWGDFGFRFQSQWKNDQFRYLFSDSYTIQGAISNHLSFHANFFRYQRKQNAEFNELTDEEIGNWSMVQPEGNVTFDNVYSSLTYAKNNLKIGLYHQPVIWGNGRKKSLTLSAHSAPFTYLGMDYQYKNINFSFLHGALMNDSTRFRNADFEIRNQEKYIAAHRISLALLDGKVRLGFSEMVIYGNRNIEPGYLLPVNFYWSIEHSLNDRDNSLMAFDFRTNFLPNFTFYGTFFLDELRFGELFNKWWANKHGIQIGANYSQELFSIPITWQIEAMAVRPWTYSHKYFINTYTNNGVALGFPYAGNAQLIELSTSSWLTRRTRLQLRYQQLKQGLDDTNQFYGGDPTISYEMRDKQLDNTTEWLMGNIDIRQSLTLQLDYEFINDSFLVFKCQRDFTGDQDLFIDAGIALDF